MYSQTSQVELLMPVLMVPKYKEVDKKVMGEPKVGFQNILLHYYLLLLRVSW